MKLTNVAALVASLALLLTLGVQGVFAADYSSVITDAGADLIADLTPTLLAVAVIGAGVIALFIGLKLAFKGMRRIG